MSSVHPVRKPPIAKIFSQRAHLNASLLHTCNTNKACTSICFFVLNEVKCSVCFFMTQQHVEET